MTMSQQCTCKSGCGCANTKSTLSFLRGDEVAVFHKKPHFVQGKFYPESVLGIYDDDDPMNPRTECDNVGHMICFHKRYDIGDKTDIKPEDFSKMGLRNYLIKKCKAEILLPLYLLDHSGLWISTGRFECDPGGWDTSGIGYIYCTKKEIAHEWGDTPEGYEKARQYLLGEVENYNEYLTGNCYGYIEYAPDENGDWQDGDSCWGFLGNYKYILNETGYDEKDEIMTKRRY
jgi:hypothetical protein